MESHEGEIDRVHPNPPPPLLFTFMVHPLLFHLYDFMTYNPPPPACAGMGTLPPLSLDGHLSATSDFVPCCEALGTPPWQGLPTIPATYSSL